MFLKRFHHLYELRRTRISEPKCGPDSLRLHRNEKPADWPKELLERIYSSIPDNLLQRYPDASAFYAKLAQFLSVPAENLLVTSGIDEPIRSILTLACDPGDTFVATPGYAMYEVYGRILGLKLAQIVYDPNCFTTASEFCSKIPTGAKVVFLPNPSQPVENCFDLDALARIAADCKGRDVLFVVDEAYHFFGAPTALPLIDRFDNLLVMRSFSKAFGAASLRLGYVAGARKALGPLSAFRLAHEANALTLHAGAALLDGFDAYVKPSVEAICEGRDFLRQKAEANGLKAWGSVSNNVLIDLGDAAAVENVVNALEAQEIYVKSGFSAPLDRYILVTCGNRDMMARFFTALQAALAGKTSTCMS